MSRMTKFLKQKAVLQLVKRDELGNPEIDIYGDISYEDAVTVRCRKRRNFKEVLSAGGVIIRSAITYTLDDSYEITVGDLLDGKPIIDYYEYVNENGIREGFKAVV